MKTSNINTEEIKNNVNNILNSYDESDLYQFALYNAMRNYKEGKEIMGDPCTPKYSLSGDEWEFCELWRVGGMAWTKDIDKSVFTEWYYGSVAERICASAYRVASFYALPNFFDIDEDNGTEYLKDLHKDLCRWESVMFAKEYWVQGEWYGDWEHLTNGRKFEDKYYISLNPEEDFIMLKNEYNGSKYALAPFAIVNDMAMEFYDLDMAISYVNKFIDESKEEIVYAGVVKYEYNKVVNVYERWGNK